MSKRKQTTVKRDTGNKGGVVILRSGNRTKTLSVGSLMKEWNVTLNDARYLLLHFKDYNHRYGTLTLDDYENLTKADINGILGY